MRYKIEMEANLTKTAEIYFRSKEHDIQILERSVAFADSERDVILLEH